jgi:hypothetical protein
MALFFFLYKNEVRLCMQAIEARTLMDETVQKNLSSFKFYF